MSSRVQRIIDMVKSNEKSNKDEEIEHMELRQKDDCFETLPTMFDLQFQAQIEKPTLEEPAFLLDNSSDSNSIPNSQHSLSLSLLDDAESGFEVQKLKTRPNVIVQETDSDTSVATCLTNSSLDFSSDDSVADPDFRIKNDLEMTDTDSDEDKYINLNFFTNSQLLTSEPGPSGFHKNNIQCEEQKNKSMTLLTPVEIRSENIDCLDSPIPDSRCDSVNTQVPSVGTSSVDTESPCENESYERKGRKRKANPNLWKRNLTKLLKNSGKAYTSLSKSKKNVAEKKMGPVCSEKCKFQCSKKFTTEERLHIFSEYWNTSDLLVQREFIYCNMTEIEPKYRHTRVGSTRKNFNQAYYLPLNNERTRVCKVFFMNTLAVSDKSIRTVLKKRKSTLKDIQLQDLRGKHNNHHKIDISLKAGVKAHINSIPRIESHYCRAQTRREYIEGGLTVAAMHRNYVEKCLSENKPHVSYPNYYNIFRNEFNISFFQPKKDQCEECTAFNNSEDKTSLQEKHEEHLKEKSLSRAQKENDKENVSENFIVAVYDLQAIMPCPRGDVSCFYYIPKINLLNFTITELGSKATTCFVWHEGEGGRGANEIGSCVLAYLEELNAKATKHFDVVFYSDNCCGQQKNKFMVAMYQYAISNFSKLNSITHKFVIKGHTQNEGDAVHSTIQKNISRALKSSPIYVPDQYITLIKTAKKKGAPYLVKELTHESFFNLKTLASSGNYTINEDGSKVKWSDIKIIRIDRRNVNMFLYKTSYQEEEFKSVVTQKKKQQKSSNFINIPKKLYTQKINISQAKKQGILNLIKKNIIPKYYEGFFSSL